MHRSLTFQSSPLRGEGEGAYLVESVTESSTTQSWALELNPKGSAIDAAAPSLVPG
jgi:hypothetical protein